jgi:hypothetical protein
MKTVTVQSILLNAASRAGLDGSSISSLSSTTQTIMLSNLDIHLRSAWEFFDWPELTRIEERTVQTGAEDDLYIDLEQTGSPTPTPMGTVFEVFQDNPNTHAAPRQIGFWVDNDKIRLPSDCPDEVYVRFRTVPTDVEAALQISVQTALALNIPQILADYIRFMLTSDLLTEDGQEDKSQVMQQRAETYLVSEMDKIVFQQRQPRRWSAQVGPY